MKNIFKWFSLETGDAKIMTGWVAATLVPELFDGVDRVLFVYLQHCAKLAVTPKKSFLESFLFTDGRRIIKESKIKLQTMEHYDYNEPGQLEEAYNVIALATLSTYDAYTEGVNLEEREFKVDMYEYLNTAFRDKTQAIMANVFPRLVGKESTEEITTDMIAEIAKYKNILSTTSLDKLDFLLGKPINSNKIMRFLFKTGIPAIDEDTGGVLSKQLWSLAGAPGTGKTRMMLAHFVYSAAVDYKIGVRVNTLELSIGECESILITIHLTKLYGGKVKIPDKLINSDKLTPEQRRYVEAAKGDLFNSGKYGRIIFYDEPLIVETYERELLNFLKFNQDVALVCTDYAGIVKSVPQAKFDRNLKEFEAIGELYKISKQVAKITDTCCFILNQFNADGVDASSKGKSIIAGHVQGGQIIERHSDFDLAMTRTPEQELAKIQMLSTVKQRSATGFKNVPLAVDLSVAYFRQTKISNVN